jgi:hypothetical protein
MSEGFRSSCQIGKKFAPGDGKSVDACAGPGIGGECLFELAEALALPSCRLRIWDGNIKKRAAETD